MAAIQIKTATKVIPQCYAYTTPGVPAHDGWTKIGFTERDVETRVREQTHTVGAYNLLNSPDFPTLRIGRCKLVMKTELVEWLKSRTNRTP